MEYNTGKSYQQRTRELQNLIIFLEDNDKDAFSKAIAYLENEKAYDEDVKTLGLLQLIKIAKFKLNPNKDEQTLAIAKKALETLKILVNPLEITLGES